jgi:hypothetical protein
MLESRSSQVDRWTNNQLARLYLLHKVKMAGEGDQVAIDDAPVPSAVADSNGVESGNRPSSSNTEPSSDKKRVRTGSQDIDMADSPVKRQKGVAPIKAECVALPNMYGPH